MKTFTTIEGQTVKIGDWVGFKADIEQSGQIVEIETTENSRYLGDKLTLKNTDGFPGDYLRYTTETTQYANDCWIG